MKLNREKFERNMKENQKNGSRIRGKRIAVVLLACALLAGNVASKGALADRFLSLINNTLFQRTIAAETNWDTGSTYYLEPLTAKKFDDTYGSWWRNYFEGRWPGITGAYNWRTLQVAIERWEETQPLTIVISDIKEGQSFDPLVRDPIVIGANKKIRLVGETSKGRPAAIEFNRLGGTNFGSMFVVQEGGELCLGEKLIFEGTMRDQTTETVWVKETITTGGTSTVPPGSGLSFGGIGNHFRVGGTNYVRDFNTSAYPSGIRVANGNETPTIQLFTSKDGYNKSVTSNSNNTALFDTNYYYILCYDTGLGIQVIDIEGEWARNLNAFKVLSFEEKKRFLWTVQTTSDGGKYLKNFVTGKVLTNSGNALSTTSPTITTETWVQKSQYYTHPKRALGDSTYDGFPGGGYFVTSSGTFTLDGTVLRDLVLPATDINSTGSDGSPRVVTGRNSAPIVINGGTFNMNSGAIYNNQVGYIANESKRLNENSQLAFTSTGSNDQTQAITPDYYYINGEKAKDKTGSAGAVIINGNAVANISGGTIGSTSKSNDDRLHFARNYLATEYFDGNKGSSGAITLNNTATLNMTGGAIVGNMGVSGGTVLMNAQSAFHMTGGSIIGNYNWGGGAVNVWGTATFNFGGNSTMPDIAGNDNMQCGGGIFVGSNNVNLISGRIRENTSYDCGGGVYVRGHASANARVLRLKHATNIFNNNATSSGIDVGNIHKAQTSLDKQIFGEAWQNINDNNKTSDYLNAGGRRNIDKYTTGSGGGIWLCPAGSIYMGYNRPTVNLTNNHAQIQGDDFMKDNGADGGLLFGTGTNGFWNNNFRVDNAVSDGAGGYTDSGNRNPRTDFNTASFSSSQSLKLKSKAQAQTTPTNNQLNIYNNTARRGGGLGADGTIVFSTETVNENIVQARLSLTKEFSSGVNPQDVRIRVAVKKKNTNGEIVIGEYHLSDNADTVKSNNDALMEDELVTYETGYKVTFGLPQYVIPPGGTTTTGNKQGEILYNDNGVWNDDWELVLYETDLNGNPLSSVMTYTPKPYVSGVNLSTDDHGTQSTDANDPKVIINYKTIYFNETATNVNQPVIEKYVNNVVHHDVLEQNEEIEYEIMAYIPEGATSLEIRDTLPDELMFVNASGTRVTSGQATQAIIAWSYMENNDHKADGTGDVSRQTGTNDSAGKTINSIDLNASGPKWVNSYTGTISGKTMTIAFGKNGKTAYAPDWLQGKWFRIRFRAKLDPDQYQAVLTRAREQSVNGYQTVTESGGRVYWARVNSDNEYDASSNRFTNAPVIVPDGKKDHTGVENHTSISVNYNNSVSIESTSNTVTVKPSEPTVEKYVNNVVHADLSNFDEVFTYSVMAYVPEGATQVTIEDELIKELQLCGTGRAPVIFSDDHLTVTSNNINNVVFSSRQGLNDSGRNQFDIITTNDHNGNGSGTVSSNNSNAIKRSFLAIKPDGSNSTAGFGRFAITESSAGRQKITLTLDKSLANDKVVFDAMDSNKARWIRFSFKARIRPEYYVAVANKIKSANDNTQNNIGWEKITDDTPVANGAKRAGESGQPSVINYNTGGYHAGEANKASMTVTVDNGFSVRTKNQPSNTVTVRPEVTSLHVYKDWINASLKDMSITSSYAEQSFIEAFANNLTLICTQQGTNISDVYLGVGSDYTVSTVTQGTGSAGSDNDPRHWTVTYKRNGTSTESPIVLVITTSNGISPQQDGTRRATWDISFRNLPKISGAYWSVRENNAINSGFEAPSYSGIRPGNTATDAQDEERIRNLRKKQDKVEVRVKKEFINYEARESDWVGVGLFATFKDENGNPITLAIDASDREDWNLYGPKFEGIKKHAANGGEQNGAGWLKLEKGTDPYNWEGKWTNLPKYLDGDENNPITYQVVEGCFNEWPGNNNANNGSFVTEGANVYDINSFIKLNKGGDFSYYITTGTTTSTDAEGNPLTIQTNTIHNERKLIEKYVSNAVHADLTTYAEPFVYDILAYMPMDATEFVITDTLPDSLEFVDENGYGSATNGGSFNKNKLLFSAYEQTGVKGSYSTTGRFVMWASNDHIGNGSGNVAGRIGDAARGADAQVHHDQAKANRMLKIDGQKLTFTLSGGLTGDDRWFFQQAQNNGYHWVHLRFKVRIKPSYYNQITTRLTKPLNTSQEEDAALGWAIIRNDSIYQGERIVGEVKQGYKRDASGAYLSYGSAHEGLSNDALLRVDNHPEVKSNTVTVKPEPVRIAIQKHWRGVTSTADIGYFNGTNAVPYLTSEPNYQAGRDFMRAFAQSFVLSDSVLNSTTGYADYFHGWQMQEPIRGDAWESAGNPHIVLPAGTYQNNTQLWYVTWKRGEETHPARLVIVTSNGAQPNISDPNRYYRWELVWENLPSTGNIYHVTEATQLSSYNFNKPQHPNTHTYQGGSEGYVLNGQSVANNKTNTERLRVDVRKNFINIDPDENTSIVVGLKAWKANKEPLSLNGAPFTTGTGNSNVPYETGHITLNKANGFTGAWSALPKYTDPDNPTDANRITYTVYEVSYRQGTDTLIAKNQYYYDVYDNANNKVINENGEDKKGNITFADSTTTGFDYTLNNKKPAVEKYVNQAVHADLPSFDTRFTYDIIAYIPEGAKQFTITDTLPAALEYVDRNGQTLYNYDFTTSTRATTVNSAFAGSDNQVQNLIYSKNGSIGYVDLFSSNNHKGNGTGSVTGNDAGDATTFTAHWLKRTVTSEGPDKPQTLTFSAGDNNPNFWDVVNSGKRYVQIRFDVRIRPEYYFPLASRMANSAVRTPLDEDLGWAHVKEDTLSYGEKIQGDGSIQNALKWTSGNSYVSFGDAHAGEGNYASLKVGSAPEIYSNTVTVVPVTTSLSVNKNWVGDDASDRYLDENGNVRTDRQDYVRQLAQNFVVSTSVVPDITLYGGVWTMDDPVRQDGVTGLGANYWKVTWSRMEGGTKVTAPVVLTIRTDNTGRKVPVKQDEQVIMVDGVRWNFTWSGLPLMNGQQWQVKEKAAFSHNAHRYDAPQHFDANNQPAAYMNDGGSVTNILVDSRRYSFPVKKAWRNLTITGSNGAAPVSPTTYAEIKLIAEYTKQGTTQKVRITDVENDPYFRTFNVKGSLKLTPEANWEGAFENLPYYYQGYRSQPITWSIEESGAEENGVSVTGYTTQISVNAAGDGFEVNNVRPAIEKYVNHAVHAELPSISDVFEYDLMVYVPTNSDHVEITDRLPAALEYVEWESGVYVKSARGEMKNNEIDLFGTHDHDGSGAGFVSNVTAHQAASNGIYGSWKVDAENVRIVSEGIDGAQTLTVVLDKNRENDKGFFGFIDRYSANWVRIRVRAKFRTGWYERVLARVSEDHSNWISSGSLTDEALGWAIVKDDTDLYGEKIQGDGNVINARMQNEEGQYVSFDQLHAGEGNYASVKINHAPDAVYSNTVTVIPTTHKMAIDKVWAGDNPSTRPSIDAFRNQLVLNSMFQTSEGTTLGNYLEAKNMTVVSGKTNTWTGTVSGVNVTLEIQQSSVDENRYEAVWSGLPRLNDTHYYTVTETPFDGYTTTYDNSDTTQTGLTITATEAFSDGDIRNTMREIAIPVTKIWYDEGLTHRPASINLTVTGTAVNGSTVLDQFTRDVTVTSDAISGWTGSTGVQYTITGLPQYYQADGVFYPYNYTVRESEVSGYLPVDQYGNVLTGDAVDVNTGVLYFNDVSGLFESSVTLYNLQTTQVRFKKEWVDDGTTDRPDEIRVVLRGHANGVQVYNTANTPTAITAADNWTYVFTDLPRVHTDGTVISYTVEELSDGLTDRGYVAKGDNYSVNAAPAANGYDASITNEKRTDLTVQKNWITSDVSKLPDSITFKVYGTTNVTLEHTTTIKRYVPVENTGSYEINEDTTGSNYYSFVVSASDNWRKTMNNLPMFDADGNRITWYAGELSVSKDSTDSSFTNGIVETGSTVFEDVDYRVSDKVFVNGSVLFTNVEHTKLNLKKVWEGNEINSRPTSIEIRVKGTIDDNGTEKVVMTERAYHIDSTDTSNVLVTGDVWIFTIPGLKMYDTNGNKITYTVTETVPSGFQMTASATSVIPADANPEIVITNTRITKTSITVRKVWSPEPETDQPVTVQLVAVYGTTEMRNDAQALGEGFTGLNAIEWIKTLNGAENWTSSWTDLPTNEIVPTQNRAIQYRVEEISSHSGYNVSIKTSVDASTGHEVWTITNAKPDIEKYVNTYRPVGQNASAHTDSASYDGDDGGVHTDLTAYDEIFTYDIMSYVTKDADKVMISDVLNEAVDIVDGYGHVITDGIVTGDVYLVAKNANADFSAPELSEGYADASFEGPSGALTSSAIEKRIETVTQGDKSFRKLTVTIDLNQYLSETDKEALRGKWVQVTFNARIKDAYLTQEALLNLSGTTIGTDVVDGYGTIPNGTDTDDRINHPKMDVLNVITGNMEHRLVDYDGSNSIPDGHTGLINRAQYSIEVNGNANAYQDSSNKVTVKAPLTSVSVSKEWVGGTPDLGVDSNNDGVPDAVVNYLNNLIVLRSDGVNEPYLWGSAGYDETAPTQKYKWDVLKTNGTNQYSVQLIDKGTSSPVPDADSRRIVTIETAPSGLTAISGSAALWRVTFTGLPVIRDVDYYVQEKAPVTGYLTPVYNNTNASSHTSATIAAYDKGAIINIKNQTVSLSVTKNWDDSSNTAGFRPEAVSFVLSAREGDEGDFYLVNITDPAAPIITKSVPFDLYESLNNEDKNHYRITINKDASDAENNAASWSRSGIISNLPQYVPGSVKKYTYRLTEIEKDDRYTVAQPEPYGITGTESAITFTATNKYEPRSTSIQVEKQWDDTGFVDYRPDIVRLQLWQKVGDGDWEHLSGKDIEVKPDPADPDKNWKGVFTDLVDARNVQYEVREVVPDGYEFVSEESTQPARRLLGGYSDAVIMNRVKKGSLHVNKLWIGDVKETRFEVSLILEGYVDGSTDPVIEQPAVNLPANHPSDPVTATEEDWKYTFENLPFTYQGKDVTWRVKEQTTNALYTVSYGDSEPYASEDPGVVLSDLNPAGTAIVRNTRTDSEKTKLSVSKQWTPDSDEDTRRRPDKITYVLKRDGDPAFEERREVIPSNTDKTDWDTVTFDNLDVKDVYNNDYVYRIEELMEGGSNQYTYNVSAFDRSNMSAWTTTVENTYQKKDRTSVEVMKVWEDGNNTFDTRPAAVKMILSAENDSSFTPREIILDDSNNWRIEVGDLRKYLDEKNEEGLIIYTVREVNDDTADPKLSDYELVTPVGNLYEFTGDDTVRSIQFRNRLKHKTKLSVTKNWDDAGFETIRPEAVRVNVIRIDIYGNEAVTGTYTLSESNGWKAETGSLAPYDDNGDPYHYRVEEVNPHPAYQVTYQHNTEPYITIPNYVDTVSTTITNKRNDETQITASKTWRGDDGEIAGRPDSIDIILMRDGTEIDRKTTDESVGWTIDAFTGLPRYDSEGREYRYQIREELNGGTNRYSSNTPMDVSFDNTDVEVINTYHEPDTVAIQAWKRWVDDNNALATRPEDISLVLKADGSEIETLILNEANGWYVMKTGLREYSDENKKTDETRITYTLEEQNVPSGYVGTVDDSAFTGVDKKITFTNTLRGKTNLTVTKRWVDSGHEAERPEVIDINLYRSDSSAVYQTKQLLKADDYAPIVFDDLDLYDADGRLYTYRIEETGVNDPDVIYDIDYMQPSFADPSVRDAMEASVTNTRIVPDKTRITAEKTWEGDTDLTSIGFTLSAGNYNLAANGIQTSYTMTKNALGEWKMEINDLPKLTNGTTGDEINYKLSENVPNGYTLKSTDVQDQPDGKHFVFTNVKNAPPKISVSIRKVWKDTGYESDRALIAVTLVRNGIKLPEKTAVLNELNGYSATITDLEEFDSDGNRYVYSVEESFNGIDNYEVSVAQTGTQLNKNEIVVTNTRKPEKVSVRASKIWVDQTAAGRPQSIIIHLLRNGQRIAQKTISGPDWDDAVFEDLDKYSSVTGSTKILNRYTVEEEMTTNAGSYMVSIEQPAADGSDYTARIKNSATQKTTASTKATTGKTSTGATTTAATGKTTSTGATTSASLPTRGATTVIKQIRTTPQDNVTTVHKLTEEEAGSALGQLRQMVNNVRNVLTNDPTSVLYPVLLLISMGGLPFLIGISKKKDDDDDHDPDGGGKKVKKKVVQKGAAKKKSASRKKAGKKKEEPKIRLNVH